MPSRYLRFIEEIRKWNSNFNYQCLSEGDATALTGENWHGLKDRFGSYASISNYIRLVAIYKFGGIYLDVDCECVRPLGALTEHSAFASVVDHISLNGSPDRICNAVFGAEAGSPWVKWQIDNMSKWDLRNPNWGVIAMSCAPRDQVKLLPTKTFYPWHWDEQPKKEVGPETLVIHHWDGDWRDCK